jgi:hypothetical protein
MLLDFKPRIPKQAHKLLQRIAPEMAEEYIVTAPEKLERRHRDEEIRARRRLGDVFIQQAPVVLDMFQYIHHEHQVGFRVRADPAIADRFARVDLIPFGFVVWVHA